MRGANTTTSTNPGHSTPRQSTPKHSTLLLGTVMFTTVIPAIDATIANVALPHMQGALGATQDQIAWVLTSYVVASAICLPLTGFLATRLGQRRLLNICMGGFLITSVLCGAATSLSEMVIFRILQGAFGAGLAPLGQAIVMGAFPREQHGRVLAIWGMGAMAGPIMGPTLGGFLTETLNWRWIFYVNVPLCAAALIGSFAVIPETKSRAEETLDLFGFGLLSVAIGTFQLMLDRGHSLNWFESSEIVIEACITGLALYLFAVHSFTAKKPFLEPRLFKDRNLTLSLVITVLLNVVLVGQMVLLPSYLQNLMNIPVDKTGMLMMPRGLTAAAGMLITGRLIGRVDSRWLLVIGFVMLGHSMFDMSRINLYVSDFTIVRIGLVQGLGSAMVLATLTHEAFTTLAPELRTEGASIYTLMRNLGSSVGISVLVAHVAELTQTNHQKLGEQITHFLPPGELPPAWDVTTNTGAMLLNSEITRQAASIGYLDAYLLMAILMMITTPLCFLFKRAGHTAGDAPLLVAEH